ncbi:Retrovirus-related pol Polyprotein [Phytophthora palmivora]|uniref:Retrovirus-related pol Polyprotein n=1 Tax=Phytophthora palmivora TaxID=4796 RepID=A0A2P4YMX0_9STRA|nr:Retrovirus-related pol Polyprotein [Phytophthora palmivora]
MLANSPISWLSRKDHTVVLSTTETEYISMCHYDLLKLLLSELGFATTQHNLIHEDNQSCIKICYNLELHGESKHIHVRCCFCAKMSNATNSLLLLQYQRHGC